MILSFFGLRFKRRRSVWIFPVSLVALTMLFVGPLGTKFGIFDFQLGLLILAFSFFVSTFILLVEFVIFLKTLFSKGSLKSSFDMPQIFFGLFVFFALIIQLIPALDAPPIHNISTNTQPAPRFEAVVDIRKQTDSNPLEFRSNPMNEQLQKHSYPGLLPYRSNMKAHDLIRKIQSVLQEMGMEVVDVDLENLRIESVSTSFWFGFKDDVLIQVRDYGDESLAEIRSVSRVGLSDLGKNASRIKEILEKLENN